MKRAAVVGAAGYAGVEAVRLLSGHPGFELACITSSGNVGEAIADLYPALSGTCDLRFDAHDADTIARKSDIAFLAVPHTASLKMTPELVDLGVQVIDLSADYRLGDANEYEAWYGQAHTSPELLERAVYGLPEVARDALSAGCPVVACPGCYPTASALAVLPVAESGLLADAPVIIAALSGVSGAGRKPTPKTHFCNADESVCAYGLPHRHTPEIAQTLSRAAKRKVDVVFTPHLVPMTRGLLATAHIPLAGEHDIDELLGLYHGRYDAEPFVSVCEKKTMPQTSWVKGSNRAVIGLEYDASSNTLVASCAIDNLVKGAAGQAVQAANLVCGYPETMGLDTIGPVV